MWPMDAEDGVQMTSVAGIKFVQNGLQCSPTATVIQHGGHTHIAWYT